jgi:diguanylate cyclase (GGDEF)-like protein
MAGTGREAAEFEEIRRRRAAVARHLGCAPARLVGLDPELLELIERRLVELEDRAAVDELTGALRRAAGLAALEREVRRARRFGDTRLAVAFIDVDHLKLLNDSKGHVAGDALLRELARLLRRRLRAYDLVVRWGGDEFLCCLPGAGRESALDALRDLAHELRARTGWGFTVGVAELGEAASVGQLVARADADLYLARSIARRGTGAGLERWRLGRQNRHGRSAHSPAYATPTRGPRSTLSGAGRTPSSST